MEKEREADVDNDDAKQHNITSIQTYRQPQATHQPHKPYHTIPDGLELSNGCMRTLTWFKIVNQATKWKIFITFI